MNIKTETYFSQDPSFPSKLIIGSLFIGAFLGYLNETLLNVALTTLMTEFAVDRTLIQWLVTGFLLVMGAVTPLTASIIQWFKSKTIVLITLTIFVIGSLICAFATNFYCILLGRIVQAISAALMVPILINTIFAIYPPNKRGRAMSLVTMMFTAAPAIGPTLSGFIVDHFGWRYLFLFPLPFLIFAFIAVSKYFNINVVEINRPKIDIFSAILSILGFGGLVFAISNYAHLSTFMFVVISCIALGFIACFIRRQFYLDTPLLNLSILNNKQFRYVVILVFLAYFVFLGLELLMPMYIQQVLLFSATAAGLVLLPASISQAIFSPIFGVLLDKKGGRYVVIPGAFFMLIGTALLFFYMNTNSDLWLLAIFFAIFAVSITSAMTSETHGLNHLPKKYYPHGTALTTLAPIAGALGGSFFVELSVIIEHIVQGEQAQFIGIKTTMAVALFIAIVFGYFAGKIKKLEKNNG